ncbi:DUF4127 family protein [Peribacillus loiseleuriae]|uniref:DUF4127 family protein n=1 Tax=Peribacillus loiseleuriae TaxID=1679170 RepID=UPI003CFEF5D8
MKKSKLKSLLASVLTAGIAVSLFAGIPLNKVEAALPNPVSPNKTVMLIPLDDRPVNTDMIVKAGASSNIKIIMPPKEIISTSLQSDSYGTGSKGGNANAVAQWVRDNKYNADGFIIAADMLHSGGLVESRSLSPDYSVSQGTSNLGVIDEIKSANPTKPVYVFDTVMRLASTSEYEGLDSAKYQAFRNFADQERKVDSSSHSNVKNTYRYNGTGGTYFNTYGLTTNEIEDYYSARARKFDLNKVVVDKAVAGKIDFTVFGVDDSSPNKNIQYSERKWLEYQNLNTIGTAKSAVVADADTVGLTLMSRMAKTLYNQPSLKMHVEYFGTDWKTVPATDPFGYESPHATMKKQIEISGGTYEVTKANADLSILALTPNSISRGSLVNMFNTNAVNSIPTAIIDMYSDNGNAPDPYIIDQILNNGTNGSRMVGYSGWNTLGNRMGLGVGMAGTRMHFITHETDPAKLRDASSAYASFLIDRIAEDQGYKNRVSAKIKKDYGSYNTYNFKNSNPVAPISTINTSVLSQMQTEQNNIKSAFSGRRVIERVNTNKTLELAFFNSAPSLTSGDANLPWNRTFEVKVNTSPSSLY